MSSVTLTRKVCVYKCVSCKRVVYPKPIIVTTNNNLDRREEDENIYRTRINDRLRSVCLPVEMENVNVRAKLIEKHNMTAIEVLGGGYDDE